MNVKTIIKPVVEEMGKFVDTAKEQVTLADSDQSSADDTKKLVEDIYKPEEVKSPEEIAKKQAKDQEKLAKTRARLAAHQTYFQSLNSPKAPEEPKAEELERKKNQEMVDLQQKENEKPPPLAVQRGQRSIESQRGSSG